MKPGTLFENVKIYLVDMMGFIFRAYHAIPHLSSSRGLPTNAAFGIANMLYKLLREENVKYGAIVYDRGRPEERLKIYREYKANRPSMPDDLQVQLPYIYEIIEASGFPALSFEGYEADDVIATLSKKLSEQGCEVVIVSGDKDLLSLVTDRISMLDTMKDRLYRPKDVKDKFGVEPEKLPDLLAITGDKIDNVPGVKGIGEKTAVKLLNEWGSIDAILENLDKIPESIRKKIKSSLKDLEISRKLVALKQDLPIEVSIDDLKLSPPDRDRLRRAFRELEFQKLLHEMASRDAIKASSYNLLRTESELGEVIRLIEKEGVCSFDLETTSLDPITAEVVGFSISTGEGRAWYLPLRHSSGNAEISAERAIALLKGILQNPKIKKCGQNIKYDISVLKKYGVEVEGEISDSMVGAWLLNPLRKRNDLDNLAAEYLGYRMISYEELTGGKGKNAPSIADLSAEEVKKYACEDADVAFRICREIEREIEREGLTFVYREIEMPLVRVLSSMELAGVRIDTDYLEALGREMKGKIDRLREEITSLAGEEFNPDSPKQLSHVLFQRLGLKKGKRTKTGYSTDVEVLKKLKDEHPIVPHLLEYRSLTKLYSTYVEGLRTSVHPLTGRVHTSFNQTGTATGRLSSSNPNLQNIPARDEGQVIRKAFVAEEGWVLISADYSQVELRILAHITGDKGLRKAFEEGKDIHTETAVKIFGVKPQEVTPDMRRKAKVINFGIVYGMSPHGLSEQMGISRSEAKDYIDAYFRQFPGVKEFIESHLAEARKNLVVRTLFGRLRPVPELRSDRKDVQSQGERIAINTPIQGSAADIIKLAMIKVHGEFQKRKMRSRLILQVHDELVVESPEEEVPEVVEILKECMEGAAELSVPLKVDVSTGKNWAEAHP